MKDTIPNFSDSIFKKRSTEELKLEKKLQKDFIKKNKIKYYGESQDEYELKKRKTI